MDLRKVKYFAVLGYVLMWVLAVCKSEKTLNVLSRQRRYLTFPKGSSLQMVFDGASPIVDYTLYAVIGITASVSWELPHNPFYYDDDFSSLYSKGQLAHRNDEDISNNHVNDRISDSYYFGNNKNLLQNETNGGDFDYYVNGSETYKWNKLIGKGRRGEECHPCRAPVAPTAPATAPPTPPIVAKTGVKTATPAGPRQIPTAAPASAPALAPAAPPVRPPTTIQKRT